jgi:serine O-acetyltransferase
MDYYRMTGTEYKPGIKSFITFVVSHQIRFMKLWRKTHCRRTLWRRFRLIRYARKYGLEISADAEIGRGCYLGHPYNITVGSGVKIGDNVNLHKGCTIGRENRGKREGVPTIGNCVSVGINSTIVGNVKIGNDVMIAPNSFVNFDVPDHSIVIGSPGVIHQKDEATKGYVGFLV